MQPIPARTRLPGHDPLPAEVELVMRSGWARAGRAMALAAVWPLAALISFLIPPHGEPLMLVLFGGGYLIYREWSTRYVIRRLRASCPRCARELRIRPNQRLSSSLALPCYGCHFTPVLEIPDPGAERLAERGVVSSIPGSSPPPPPLPIHVHTNARAAAASAEH